MSWMNEVQEIQWRRARALGLGGEEAVARHHAQGKLTIRERIHKLVDEGTFVEIGSLAAAVTYDNGTVRDVTPAPYVAGLARIDGRHAAIGGEDFTVRGGSSWGGDRRKGGQGGFSEDLAFHYKIPLVNLIDGAGGSVTTIRRRGRTILPGADGFERSVSLLGQVPVVSAVLGTAAGGPAGRAILSHWSVMTANTSQVFAAGPPVVERSTGESLTKDQLGGAAVAVDCAGSIDNAAESEAHCFALVRKFLSYLPSNVWELPPVQACVDPPTRRDESLASIVPRERKRPYDMRKIVQAIVDDGSFFELQPTFGKSLVVGLARMNGRTTGFVANNPMVLAGAMDVKATRKQTHFLELCDCFHIPIVFLVDVPGFMVGLQAEQDATLREGMRSVYVAAQLAVPTISLIVRKCYGMAGMAATSRNGVALRLAWPSAEWGSLPIEGGVVAAFRREIDASDDPRRRAAEIEDELRRLASPFRTAEAFGVEEIIDPADTRAYLCAFLDACRPGMATQLGPKPKAGVRP